jgi:hypothetical protein
VDGDVESHTTEVASASSAGAAGGSRQPSTDPSSPTRELLKMAPPYIPQARTLSPELIEVRLEDQSDHTIHELPLCFNPLKPKLVQIIFKNSVRTSRRTPHLTITKIKCLVLLKEVIAVHSENHTNP